jgi:hypothetical protein
MNCHKTLHYTFISNIQVRDLHLYQWMINNMHIFKCNIWVVFIRKLKELIQAPPWILVHKQTIENDRSPLVSDISANFCWLRVSHVEGNGPSQPLISVFQSGAHDSEWTPFQNHFFSENQVDLGIKPNQELWPLDHRGSLLFL